MALVEAGMKGWRADEPATGGALVWYRGDEDQMVFWTANHEGTYRALQQNIEGWAQDKQDILSLVINKK